MVMSTVPPSEIDVNSPNFGMFDDWTMIEPAKTLVSFAQENERQGKGAWASFTRKEIEVFAGGEFYFLGLLNHYILEDKIDRGTYRFTHRFVECCF